MDYFGVPSHRAQEALLKRCSFSAASIVDEGKASLAKAAGVDDSIDNDDDWHMEGAVG